ncbi:hypothetical protein HPP92_011792 [Vanilla planifolia]|uniref:Stomagen C-terminal domain-containing protein n=1 Tax=Vanilla planifolia TaxID=51239 RepID=A0A835QYA3_VANPL|nr:hypothetical protein HPP92_011792 [Vanilla planifolia]
MAIKKSSSLLPIFILCLLSSKLVRAPTTQAPASINQKFSFMNDPEAKVSRRGGTRELMEKRNGAERRRMVGSMAPHCTYNECRGCRFKCTAELVPVDAGDPISSAYRYRCVCHRF